MIAADDPRVVALVDAVENGDLDRLDSLLREHPEIAAERIGGALMSREALHVATDWPGHRPAVGAVIDRLVAAGARVDARFAGPHTETPLHWAASSDDCDAIDALVRAGADLEADGGVLTDGPPLDDAVVFAQYAAARRLVDHGATVAFWHAAALGMTDLVMRSLADGPPPPDEVTSACWHAARSGHLDSVEALVDAGADLQQVLWEDQTILDVALHNERHDVVEFLRTRSAD